MNCFHRYLPVLVFALLAASHVFGAADSPKYNVLLIIADDLNTDLGSYGHPVVQTPHLDRLASEGLLFENAYCQWSVCGPSRTSFMTGLYPDQTGVHLNGINFRDTIPKAKALPQIFRDAGAVSARVGKVYHYAVPDAIGTDGTDDPASWDIKVNPIGVDKTELSKAVTLTSGEYSHTLSWHATEKGDAFHTDYIGAAEAVRLLEDFSKDGQPFFLAVGFFRPHTPFTAPKKWFEMYPLSEIEVPTIAEGYYQTIPRQARLTLQRYEAQVNLPETTAKEAIRAYYACVSFVDDQVGRVIDGLERSGLRDKTIVIFTSDNGYHLGEHGHFQKETLYERAAKIPLIVSVPDMPHPGARTNALAELVDIYPTIAELCGLTQPEYLSGTSLVPVLENPEVGLRKSALTQQYGNYSLRTDRYRFTQYGPDGAWGHELYDHRTDPEENINLAGKAEFSEIESEFSKALAKRIEDAGKLSAELGPSEK